MFLDVSAHSCMSQLDIRTGKAQPQLAVSQSAKHETTFIATIELSKHLAKELSR